MPVRIVCIPDRRAVDFLPARKSVCVFTENDIRLVVAALCNFKEGNAFIITKPVISNLAEEIRVVRHAEELPDVLICCIIVHEVVVITDGEGRDLVWSLHIRSAAKVDRAGSITPGTACLAMAMSCRL